MYRTKRASQEIMHNTDLRNQLHWTRYASSENLERQREHIIILSLFFFPSTVLYSYLRTSLWPPIYLVADWITRSAPRASAFWFKGVAMVPSIQTRVPLLWQISETNLMSTHRRNGFVGDSVKNIETWITEHIIIHISILKRTHSKF